MMLHLACHTAASRAWSNVLFLESIGMQLTVSGWQHSARLWFARACAYCDSAAKNNARIGVRPDSSSFVKGLAPRDYCGLSFVRLNLQTWCISPDQSTALGMWTAMPVTVVPR